MRFEQAVAIMRDGGQVRRSMWISPPSIYLDEDEFYMSSAILPELHCHFSTEDILAEDWVEVKQ